MCIGMANGGKTKVDKVENFIRETNEWHRVAELNANEIIRLQAENDRLNNELHSKVEYIHEQLEIIEHKKAEIEQWKEEANKYQTLWCEDVQIARAEAIKEFADRLKSRTHEISCNTQQVVTKEDINNLVKEMVGEGK